MADATHLDPGLSGLVQQGYAEWSTDDLRRLAWGLRFTPGLCMALAVVGLATRSPGIHFLLAALGILTFFTPAHHPFDLLYNHGVRHLFGAPKLPPNPLPRRIACLLGGAMNLGIGAAFVGGRLGWAYGVGAVLILLQIVVLTSHFCVASWLFELLLKLRGRGQPWLSGEEARRLVAEGALLLDVRSPAEFSRGHLPGAVNVPVDEVPGRLDELRQGRSLVVYCAGGVRCRKACEILTGAGVEEVHELGSISRW